MRTNIALLFLSIIAFSCQKDIEFDGEIKAPKLVINSMFNDVDSFTINLSRSLPVIDVAELKGITEAKVSLFDANNSKIGDLIELGNGGYYLPNFIAKAEESYTVTASHPRYKDISATDALPKPPSVVSIDTLLLPNANEWDAKFRITVTIDDPREENYYMVEVLRREQNWNKPNDSDSYIWMPLYLTTNDPYTANFNSSESVQGNKLLFNDKGFNGNKHAYGFTIDYYSLFDHYEGEMKVDVRVYSISESVFNYYETAIRYEAAKFDPFSTPVQVFTNVEGGFGIFGGASSYTYALRK